MGNSATQSGTDATFHEGAHQRSLQGVHSAAAKASCQHAHTARTNTSATQYSRSSWKEEKNKGVDKDNVSVAIVLYKLNDVANPRFSLAA